jgi:hypothetical protein
MADFNRTGDLDRGLGKEMLELQLLAGQPAQIHKDSNMTTNLGQWIGLDVSWHLRTGANSSSHKRFCPGRFRVSRGNCLLIGSFARG